jgi:outer membrane receptor protein involved in Fe transport
LGLSRENYEYDGLDIDVSKWNPKIGVQWRANEQLQLRATYLKTLKRQLTVDQTLEPTQVAGFNQFFDDPNGTVAELYGIGFDFDASRDILMSFEYTERDTEKKDDGEQLDERITRGQISWLVNRQWTASLGFYSDDSKVRGTGRLDVSNWMVPLAVNFHHPKGFFGRATATYFEQDVQLGSAPKTDEDFGLLDLAIGYRLPKDRGRLTLEVNNAFDKDFRYLDDGYKTSDPFNVYRPFFPTRSIRFTIGLKF